MPRGMKTGNSYASEVARIDAPKAVWMAIAFSFALRLNGDDGGAAVQECLNEWRALHDNGIVPQGPSDQGLRRCMRCDAKYDAIFPLSEIQLCPLCRVAAV